MHESGWTNDKINAFSSDAQRICQVRSSINFWHQNLFYDQSKHFRSASSKIRHISKHLVVSINDLSSNSDQFTQKERYRY